MPRRDGALFKANWSPEVALYRLFSANDVLLYVGQSKDPQGRIATHRRQQPWNLLIADWSVEWHGSRGGALFAEQAAIRDECPLFNIEGNAGRERPWFRMVESVGSSPLTWGRIAPFAEAAQYDLRILDLLQKVQGAHGACGECMWPGIKAQAEECVGFGCGNPPLEDAQSYEAVMSTLYESLPWSICSACGVA